MDNMLRMMEKYADNLEEVCRQPGRAGGREDTPVHGGEEEGRPAALQHDAYVCSSHFYFNFTQKEITRDFTHRIGIILELWMFVFT